MRAQNNAHAVEQTNMDVRQHARYFVRAYKQGIWNVTHHRKRKNGVCREHPVARSNPAKGRAGGGVRESLS